MDENLSQTLSAQKNPLLIDVVVSRIYKYVDWETLKNCRLVCYQWKDVADFRFITQSVFTCGDRNSQEVGESLSSTPPGFPSLFKCIHQQEFPFSAFKFELELMSLTGPMRDLYLNNNKGKMTQLKIVSRRVGLDNVDPRAIPDIATNQNVENLLGPNLVKLHLGDIGDSWQWEACLDKLTRITQLELSRCDIVVNTGLKLTPRDLKLSLCFLKQSLQIPIIRDLSALIDFRSLTKLHLASGPRYQLEIPILNLGDIAHIKDITLIGMTINCNAKIAPVKLSLKDNLYSGNDDQIARSPLLELINSTQLRKLKLDDEVLFLKFGAPLTIEEIELDERVTIITAVAHDGKDIHFITTNMKRLKLKPNKIIDLSLFSPKLEYLELVDTRVHNCIARSQPNSELKIIQLSLRGCVEQLKYFSNCCPSLVYLSLDNFCSADKLGKLDMDLFPPNMKELLLKNIFEVQVVGNRMLKLDLLVLFAEDVDTQLNKVIPFLELQIVNKIEADLVVFHCSNENGDIHLREDYIQKILSLRAKLKIQKVVFGPINEDGLNSFPNSVMFPLTEPKLTPHDVYYLLQGESGKGITKFEYYKMIPFALIGEQLFP